MELRCADGAAPAMPSCSDASTRSRRRRFGRHVARAPRCRAMWAATPCPKPSGRTRSRREPRPHLPVGVCHWADRPAGWHEHHGVLIQPAPAARMRAAAPLQLDCRLPLPLLGEVRYRPGAGIGLAPAEARREINDLACTLPRHHEPGSHHASAHAKARRNPHQNGKRHRNGVRINPGRSRSRRIPPPPARRCTAAAWRAGCPDTPRWWWCSGHR